MEQLFRKRFFIRFHRLALALLTVFPGCGGVQHDENLAAKRAVEFARIAFIQHDLEKAYGLLSDNSKRHVPFEKFKELVAKLHPKGFPTKVTATEYEPMRGENAIYIYLTGENAREQFDYVLTMEGTASSDYRVLKLDRGSAVYLSIGRKKLSKSISAQGPGG